MSKKKLEGVCPTCKHPGVDTADKQWEPSCRFRCNHGSFILKCICPDPWHAQISGWVHPSKRGKK